MSTIIYRKPKKRESQRHFLKTFNGVLGSKERNYAKKENDNNKS